MLTLHTYTLAAYTLATDDRWNHGPWGNGSHDGGAPWFWPIFPILWIAVIATVIYLFVRRGRDAGRRAGEARLAERYAAGEIGADEYHDRLAVLRTKPGKSTGDE